MTIFNPRPQIAGALGGRPDGRLRSCCRQLGMLPERQRERHRLDFDHLPPSGFVTFSVKLPMVNPAQWNGEFIAHLSAKGARLGKPKMVRIARCAAAHDTGLRSDELPMLLVSQPDAFLDDRPANVPSERPMSCPKCLGSQTRQ